MGCNSSRGPRHPRGSRPAAPQPNASVHATDVEDTEGVEVILVVTESSAAAHAVAPDPVTELQRWPPTKPRSGTRRLYIFTPLCVLSDEATGSVLLRNVTGITSVTVRGLPQSHSCCLFQMHQAEKLAGPATTTPPTDDAVATNSVDRGTAASPLGGKRLSSYFLYPDSPWVVGPRNHTTLMFDEEARDAASVDMGEEGGHGLHRPTLWVEPPVAVVAVQPAQLDEARLINVQEWFAEVGCSGGGGGNLDPSDASGAAASRDVPSRRGIRGPFETHPNRPLYRQPGLRPEGALRTHLRAGRGSGTSDLLRAA